jgi:hypothetical protein
MIYKKNCIAPLLILLLAAVSGCGQKGCNAAQAEESKEAKQLLQGVWIDEDTETAAFRMKGDSVYYPDSTSMPAYFRVVGDTLFIGDAVGYHIEKHTEHVLWFMSKSGELMKFVKSIDEPQDDEFTEQPQILTLTEVLKRDTVVFWNGNRYHLYVAINPTKYKVVRHTTNEDGLDVENVYYDNIIHLSIFQGNRQLFSRDFRKQQYEQNVPKQFVGQSILNDMNFKSADASGFHLDLSLCTPGDASCYLIEHIVSYDGKLTTKLLEY